MGVYDADRINKLVQTVERLQDSDRKLREVLVSLGSFCQAMVSDVSSRRDQQQLQWHLNTLMKGVPSDGTPQQYPADDSRCPESDHRGPDGEHVHSPAVAATPSDDDRQADQRSEAPSGAGSERSVRPAREQEEARMSERETARRAALDVLNVFEGRKGFGSYWWDDIDEDIQIDILDEVTDTIERGYGS